MPLEVRKYLYDIREAAGLVAQFTEGRSLRDYSTDPMLRSAVERQFEKIGEALNKLSKHLVSKCADPRLRRDR